MLKVNISGDTRYPANRKIIRKAISDAIEAQWAGSVNCEVSVYLVGWRKMKSLSNNYLKDNEKHSILSFPQEELDFDSKAGFINPPDEVLRFGDIVLCWPYILEEAAKEDVMVDEQLYFLVNHGTLHLLGNHHK